MALKPRLIFDVERDHGFDGIAYGPCAVGNYTKPFFFVRSGEEIDKDSIIVYESNYKRNWKKASNIRIKWADVHHKAVTVAYGGDKAFIELALPSEMEVIFMASGYINALGDDVACENVATTIEGVDCSLYEGWEFPKCGFDELIPIPPFFPGGILDDEQEVEVYPSATITGDTPDFIGKKIDLYQYLIACNGAGTSTSQYWTPGPQFKECNEKVVFLYGIGNMIRGGRAATYYCDNKQNTIPIYKRVYKLNGEKCLETILTGNIKKCSLYKASWGYTIYILCYFAFNPKLFKDGISEQEIFENTAMINLSYMEDYIIDGKKINNAILATSDTSAISLSYGNIAANQILTPQFHADKQDVATSSGVQPNKYNYEVASWLTPERFLKCSSSPSASSILLFFNPSILAVDA